MFPRLRDRFGTALDLVVEFSTLGEYRLGALPASTPSSAQPTESDHEPDLGGAGTYAGSLPAPAGRVRVRRTVAGGASGLLAGATPAARRRREHAPAGSVGHRERPGSPRPPEQPCLSADRR
jgi:hypothetical protein